MPTMSPDGKVETDSPKAPQTTYASQVDAGEVESYTTTETEAGPPIGEGDFESQKTAGVSGVSNIVQKRRKDDLLKKCSLVLHVSSFVFSLIAFIIIATNKHGSWKDFEKYQEYKYALAIAIISTVYTALQAFFQFYEMFSGRELISRHLMMILGFIGDQLMAYLLLSAASSAVPLTNRFRDATDNDYDYIFTEIRDEIFINSSAAAIGMEFIAFFALAISALISGYKLCRNSYI